MKNSVSISSIGTISPLGMSPDEIWKNYLADDHFFQKADFDGLTSYAGFLPGNIKKKIEALGEANSKYRNLDNSVLYAMLAGRIAASIVLPENTGINIGSSRGATGLFEKYHREYLNTGNASTYTSPSTTLGNISSWLTQDLQLEGPEFSHSVTCSTGMHSVLNAIAWLQSGMANGFLAGGSEAPLTAFTLAQMRAMKIYASEELDFPCRSLDMKKTKSTMILSEAAGILGLENEISQKTLAVIKGVGYGNEKLKHGASLSKTGKCLQKSMSMAIKDVGKAEIDAVILHAPGTIGGDLAEVNAVKKVFQDRLPAMTSNKWKVGHSFAASGILSLQMAVMMLEHQHFLPVPFSEFSRQPDKLDHILVNSVGFGGNAVSILVGRK